jgi:hemerythrin-like metal-binding protein
MQEKVMKIEWQDKYKIGDRKIDEEHQEWFQLANQFLMAHERQSVQACGDAFSQYTRHHFINEEAFMREIQFPFTATHAKEHDRLVSTLEKIMDVVDKDVLSKTELEEFVGYCLVKHISTYDAPLAVYIRRNGLEAHSATPAAAGISCY